MSYGLETYTSGGVAAVSLSTRLTRLLYTKQLAPNESGSVTVPGFSTLGGVAIACILDNTSGGYALKAAHNVTASGTLISWAPSVIPAALRTYSWLYVFMYK